MLKLSQISAFIETVRTEGAVAISGGYNAAAIANDAGIHLYSMHSWGFREMGIAELTPGTGESHVDLPADFGEIIAIELQGLRGHVQWTTLNQILKARQHELHAQGALFMAAMSQPASALITSALPAKRIELYPEPDDDLHVFEVWYRRNWAMLDGQDDIAQIPVYCLPLYRELVRAFTIGAWTGGQDTLTPRLNEIESGRVFAAAARQDAEEQPHSGPPQRTAVQEADRYAVHGARLLYPGQLAPPD